MFRERNGLSRHFFLGTSLRFRGFRGRSDFVARGDFVIASARSPVTKSSVRCEDEWAREEARWGGEEAHAQLQRRIVKAEREEFEKIDIAPSGAGIHLAGGAREGHLAKLDGVEPGDPDLSIREIGRNGEPGYFQEVKTPGQRLSPPQKLRKAALEAHSVGKVAAGTDLPHTGHVLISRSASRHQPGTEGRKARIT